MVSTRRVMITLPILVSMEPRCVLELVHVSVAPIATIQSQKIVLTALFAVSIHAMVSATPILNTVTIMQKFVTMVNRCAMLLDTMVLVTIALHRLVTIALPEFVRTMHCVILRINVLDNACQTRILSAFGIVKFAPVFTISTT